jgi:hypothetical protein
MNAFTHAAPRITDSALFRTATPGLKRLMKRSRGELREKGRAEYWKAIHQKPQGTQTGTTRGVVNPDVSMNTDLPDWALPIR